MNRIIMYGFLAGFAVVFIDTNAKPSINSKHCSYSKRLGTVRCRGQNLAGIPYDELKIFKSIKFHTLDFGQNNIASLDDTHRFMELEYANEVKKILLDHNELSKVPPYAFSAFSTLEHLDLSVNNLTHISTFSCHISNLTQLDLQGNPVKTVARQFHRCVPLYLDIDLSKYHVDVNFSSTLSPIAAEGSSLSVSNTIDDSSPLPVTSSEMFELTGNVTKMDDDNKNAVDKMSPDDAYAPGGSILVLIFPIFIIFIHY